MQIVHIVRQFHPAVGGMENVVLELATSQLKRGHAVRVVTLDRIFGADRREHLPPYETLAGLDIHRVPYVGSTRYPLAWRAIRHIGDADIVHVHGIDFFFDFLAWTAPFHRRKLVVSTHGGFFHTPYAAALKKLYFKTVTRSSLSRYAGVAAISAADDELFGRIRKHGLTLIENGANVAKYNGAAARRPTKTILALGRFSTNKRLDRIISFISELRRLDPEWMLKIAGRPSDLSVADVVEIADTADLDDGVEVVAWPSDQEIRDTIGTCSVIASASDYEGFGLAAVEGMSAGLFPLLSDIAPFRRLVEKTGVGVVADFDNPRSAAELFHSRWQEISDNHREHRQAAIAATTPYSWKQISEKYESFYHSVLGTKVRSILDVDVDVSTFHQAIELLDKRTCAGIQTRVIFANAHTLNHAAASAETRSALQQSIVFNDGIGVDLASRLLFGKWFPQNMNGTDFVPGYLQQTQHRYRIYFLGGRPGIAQRAAERLVKSAPQHQVAGWNDGYFDTGETADIVDHIRQSKADILLVAMGNPKQELWLTEHFGATGCQLGFGVGALFDFMAGAAQRAPRWVRSARLEWLYRMLREPRRLGRRYIVGIPVFLLRVFRQWIGGARVSAAE